MRGFMKVVLIIIAVMIGGVVLAVLKDSRGGGGYGPIGIVIAFALFAGIKAIWGYTDEKEEETTDVDKLDKS